MLVAGSTATLRGAADSWPAETSIITFVPGVIAGITFTPPVPPTPPPVPPIGYPKVREGIITIVPGVIAGIAFTPPVPPTSVPCLPSTYAGGIPSVAQARRVGAMLVIDWTGCGILQQAPAITGPWSDIYSGASPYSTQHARAMGFYRVRNGN